MRRNFCNIFLFLILIFTSINAQIFYDKYSAAKRYERAFNKNSKYSNIYLIEWNRQDDRKNRQGMYFLLSGSYTGIFNQLIQTGSSWFTKYMDDLGTEHSYYEESDR